MTILPDDSNASRAEILIVDDNEVMRHQRTLALTAGGAEVYTVADAAEALTVLPRLACQLVLIAADLPEIDGLTLCRVLRTQPAARDARLVLYAAKPQETQVLAAFEAGADDFWDATMSSAEWGARSRAHLAGTTRAYALGGRNKQLEFLADLGRSLLRATTPEEVVRRTAAATFEGLSVPLCAAVLRTEQGEYVHGFDRQGVAFGAEGIQRAALERWLNSAENRQSVAWEARNQFFLKDLAHCAEYAAPLVYNAQSKGVLIVGFDRTEDFGPAEEILVETAAQQAAMAAHIVALHQAARAAAVRLSHEVAERTAEIEAQRRLTAAIVDSLPVSLYAVDRDYHIVAWNRQREGSGILRTEALGRNVFNVLQRQPREILEREFASVFAKGEIIRLEEKTRDPETGTTQHWLISKIPMRVGTDAEVSHVITIGENVTARVNAQNAIAQADKLSAIGLLAAGVVHEINNPLATISACAEALASRVSEGAFDVSPEVSDLREYLELIRNEVFRCKGITNGLLNFSRSRGGGQSPVHLPEVLRSAAHLVTHQPHAGVRINLDVPSELKLVTGNVGKLQQAIIALAVNAIDAMPHGGTLTLRARNNGKYVVVEIKDTGNGIAPEHLPRIFDPFFTTKEVGRGTGLGLAVCYGIVSDHQGKLEVQSTQGLGTTFTISLPILKMAYANVE